MLAKAAVRHLGHTTLLLFTGLLYGCTDASEPLAPRVPAAPNPLIATIVTVTNTDDAGPGSLRQQILDAAAGSTIQFDAAIAAGRSRSRRVHLSSTSHSRSKGRQRTG